LNNIVEVRHGRVWESAEGRLSASFVAALLLSPLGTRYHAYLCLTLVAPNPLPRAHPSPSKHARQAFDFFAAYNTPHFVFVFVLCAARRRPPRPADEGAAAKSAVVGAPACVLQKLCGHEDSLLKSIAEFAGVLMRATPRAAHFKAIVTAP
jgi:hypothetical protein